MRAAYAPSEIPQLYAALLHCVVEGVSLCSPIGLEARKSPDPSYKLSDTTLREYPSTSLGE